MAYLSLKDINKIYPNGFHAVHNFNLEIEQGEFIIFVGPSGCGKSTTLRMIAGLEEISEGELYIGDKLVKGCGTDINTDVRAFGLFLKQFFEPEAEFHEHLLF